VRMVRSYSLTPSLWVGDIPMAGGIRCETVEDAVGVIQSGESAVLPHGYWATAHEVLRALGVNEDTVDDRVYFAQLAHF
jgi:hypothetical protein